MSPFAWVLIECRQPGRTTPASTRRRARQRLPPTLREPSRYSDQPWAVSNPGPEGEAMSRGIQNWAYLACFMASACSPVDSSATDGTDAVPQSGTELDSQSGGSAIAEQTPAGPGAGGVTEEGGGVLGGLDEKVIMDTAGMTGEAEEPSCGGVAFGRESRPSEVLLVVDRSGSMEENFVGTQEKPAAAGINKWQALAPTLTHAVSSTLGRGIWWGLKLFPELGGHVTDGCDPRTIVPDIHSPLSDGNGVDVVQKVDATVPDGDGTPTGHAMKFALDHLLEREQVSQNPKIIVLATDGEPNCKGPNGEGSTDYAVQQIEAAFAAGYPTYVIGVDTTKGKTRANLNLMALAGGRALPNPNPPDPNAPVEVEVCTDSDGVCDDDKEEVYPGTLGYDAFYLASSQQEVQGVFEAITEQLASCVFDLGEAPPVPENIAVDFNAARTDRDPTRTNGWEYTSDDFTQLQVYGSWCERIRTESSNSVTIRYGCPNVPIPPPR